MIKTCEYCKQEFEALRATKRFCSDKCKVANSRLSVTDGPIGSVTPPENVTVTTDKDVTVKIAIPTGIDGEDVRKMSREDIEIGIRMYAGDSWVKSPEFNELLRRLNSYTEERLLEEGYDVPASIYKKRFNQ